jgi:hypothetical protein
MFGSLEDKNFMNNRQRDGTYRPPIQNLTDNEPDSYKKHFLTQCNVHLNANNVVFPDSNDKLEQYELGKYSPSRAVKKHFKPTIDSARLEITETSHQQPTQLCSPSHMVVVPEF